MHFSAKRLRAMKMRQLTKHDAASFAKRGGLGPAKQFEFSEIIVVLLPSLGFCSVFAAYRQFHFATCPSF
jgi:hypothetical protein